MEESCLSCSGTLELNVFSKCGPPVLDKITVASTGYLKQYKRIDVKFTRKFVTNKILECFTPILIQPGTGRRNLQSGAYNNKFGGVQKSVRVKSTIKSSEEDSFIMNLEI